MPPSAGRRRRERARRANRTVADPGRRANSGSVKGRLVMIHPDYQYDSRVIPHAVGMIELGICDVILGSRVRSRQKALKSGHAPGGSIFPTAL